MKHLLIVDDEHGSRESLRTIFENKYTLSVTGSADEAGRVLQKQSVDVVLLDLMMPNKDGIAFLKDIQERSPDLPVIMVSASTSVRPVVEAIRVGACDYVTKPFDVSEIRRTVDRALESVTLRRQVRVLQTEISREYPIDGIVGQSASFQRALDDARKVADTGATVLIAGESGTGKELVARCVHAWSQRRDEPFVPVHCAAIPESLMESELFGYEKGAFTGADARKMGRFELAGSGSLFLDEVGEMSLTTQVKLLRILQEREFMRVGGTCTIQTNARIIAATARDLRAAVDSGQFRDDLFYRLSVVPIHLPPLRERRDDIPLLADYFLAVYGSNLDAVATGFTDEALHMLTRYDWPGNVRELRNVIERMLVLHGRAEETIRAEFLPDEFRGTPAAPAPPPAADASLRETIDAYERELIVRALDQANGVQTAAARILKTTRRILKYRMEKLNIRCPPAT